MSELIDKPMSTIETLNQQIATLEAQRVGFSSELMRLNGTLATAKFGKRGGIEKAIKNAEQEIKNLDRSVKLKQDELTRLEKSQDKTERTEDRQTTKQTAYEHGIDPNAAWAGAVGTGITAASNAIVSMVNPLSGSKPPVDEKKSTGVDPVYTEQGLPPKNPKDGLPMLIIIGLALGVILLMKNSK